MYTYCCLAPGEDVWPLLQPLTYTYLPAPLLLPPIQAHNFCSRPQNLSARRWAAPQEYHCFHGVSAPLTVAPPFWAFPQAYSAALQPPFLAPGYNRALRQEPEAAGLVATEVWAPWPEGGTLQAELRWGRVERTLGPRLELPDFVRQELRRVYGTYPRTDVRVTYRGGEFLVQGAPRLREPEYRVERRVLRPPASRGSGEDSPAAETAERGRRKKSKGLS
ncbi:hypothetical protein Cadr_000009478 [Camelus dromedarius]|uniref:Uncharacterized protein n=2 Tax=Camelus TaxID=9836 RepID=A0A5N4DIX4_CAMDR|nr:uncharacterized protein C10orf95 homolog [Camelus dromedarius]KAB1271133.1 hypothetical protein Cadr_000009478 [Camelus dromedarius]